MAYAYDHSQTTLKINGKEIDGFADGNDVLVIADAKDLGEIIYGASGEAVFIGKCSKGGTVKIKLLQSSKSGDFLDTLINEQRNNLAGFKQLTLDFYDTVSGDQITGSEGFFIINGDYVRGEGHNPQEITMGFTRYKRLAGKRNK